MTSVCQTFPSVPQFCSSPPTHLFPVVLTVCDSISQVSGLLCTVCTNPCQPCVFLCILCLFLSCASWKSNLAASSIFCFILVDQIRLSGVPRALPAYILGSNINRPWHKTIQDIKLTDQSGEVQFSVTNLNFERWFWEACLCYRALKWHCVFWGVLSKLYCCVNVIVYFCLQIASMLHNVQPIKLHIYVPFFTAHHGKNENDDDDNFVCVCAFVAVAKQLNRF